MLNLFVLPNVQLGQWSPKCSLAQLVCQMSNCVSGVQNVRSCDYFPNVQMGRWIQSVRAPRNHMVLVYVPQIIYYWK